MVGANYYPDDHQIDPPRLSRALAAGVARLGGKFKSGVLVTGLAIESGAVVGVETDSGLMACDRVVIAGGAWSTNLTGLQAIRTKIKPMAGQIIQVETRPPLFRHVVYGFKGYIVPRADGRVLMGSTLEDRGFDKAVTLEGINRVSGMAIEMVPGLKEGRLTGTWSGLRPAPEDGKLLLGAAKELAGLFFATGHYRNGILLTPITAEVICDLMLGREPKVDISSFCP